MAAWPCGNTESRVACTHHDHGHRDLEMAGSWSTASPCRPAAWKQRPTSLLLHLWCTFARGSRRVDAGCGSRSSAGSQCGVDSGGVAACRVTLTFPSGRTLPPTAVSSRLPHGHHMHQVSCIVTARRQRFSFCVSACVCVRVDACVSVCVCVCLCVSVCVAE